MSEDAGAGVGVTIVSGIPPVEATDWVVGWTTEEGALPVDPIKGSRILERSPPMTPALVDVGAFVGETTTGGVPLVETTATEEDAGMMTSGSPPVEAGPFPTVEEEGCTIVSGSPPVEAATDVWAVEVGGRMMSGRTPVDPRIELRGRLIDRSGSFVCDVEGALL